MDTVLIMRKIMQEFWNSSNKYTKILIASGFSIVTLLSTRILLLKIHRKITNAPPGPIGLFPILNIMPTFITVGPLTFMKDILPKYGPITKYSFFFGTAYMINDGPLAKQTFKKLKVKIGSSGDFISENKSRDLFGNSFKTIQKFKELMTQNSLNNLSIEHGIKKALKKFIYPVLDEEKQKQKAIKVDKLFRPLIFDLLYFTMTGFHLESLTDPFYTKFHDISDGSAAQIMHKIMSAVTMGKHEIKSKDPSQQIYSPLIPLKECFAEYVEKNEKNILLNKDCFYTKLYNDTDYVNTKDELMFDAALIINAGFDTVSIVIEFMLLCLAKHMKIQELIYDELSSIFKNGEVENMSLKIKNKQVNTLQAFIHEVLRMYPPTIGTNNRKVMENKMKIGGYDIPKNGNVSMNMYAVNRDKKYWKFPTTFNINNFTNEKGEYKAQFQSFGSFGYGPRSCPGIYLGKRILYNIIASLILKYRMSLPNEYVDTPIGMKLVLFVHPNPTFPIQFEERT